jgi:hypothetical protein
MLNRIQKTTCVVTVGFIILTFIYHQRSTNNKNLSYSQNSIFNLCVFNASTTQTIKLLHIVNIISYSLVSIFYASFKHFYYSNLAWLLFVLLFLRICIR